MTTLTETTTKSESLAAIGLDEVRAARSKFATAQQRYIKTQTHEARKEAEAAQAEVYRIEDAYREALRLLLQKHARRS